MAKKRKVRKKSSRKKGKKARVTKATCPHCKKTIYVGTMERIKGTTMRWGPWG